MTDPIRRTPPRAPEPADIARDLRRLLRRADRIPGDTTGHDFVVSALVDVYVEFKGSPADACVDALTDLAKAFACRGARCNLGIVVGPEGARVVDLDAE